MSDAVVIAVISGIVSLGSLAMNLLIKRSQNKLHKQINSRMDELLRLAKEKAEMEGNIQGRKDLTAENKISNEGSS